jgi:hypothetical protein
MKTIRFILAFGIVLIISGCSKQKNEKMQDTQSEDISANSFISSSAAVENNKDTTRKFIRTADLKFKVKNVINSTYDIESIANQEGGFVTYTNLTSKIVNVTTTAVSADSSLETTYYQVTNTITIRVPNTKLDTTLKLISKNIDFLDYRIIKAEDVALQILSNTLSQKRSARNEERLTTAIDNKGKKLNETTLAEELLIGKKEQSDYSKISNLSLTDQILFSTINVNIYQRQSLKRELISNNKNIDAYEPGFGSKIIESLEFGWDILKGLVLLLSRLWALFVLGLIVYFIYKKFGHKIKK